MPESAELRLNIKKRGQVKARLTRLKNLVYNFNDDTTVVVLKMHLRKHDLLLEEFNEIQNEIEILDEETDYSDERLAFESTYFEIIARMEQLIEDKTRSINSVSRSESVANHSQNSSNIKLPTINLPEFDGNYTNWLQFYDTFNALINENENINNVQKFLYLKSSLKGEASQVLHSLEASDTNYPIAWEILKNRYDNKRVIVNTHIKAIFDLPSLSKESPQQLRKLSDDLAKHLGALKLLGQPTDSWDSLIIFLVCSKLDFNSKREWESSIIGSELPKFEDFSKFLANRCQLLETIKPGLQGKPTGASVWKVQSNNNCNKFSTPHQFIYSRKCKMPVL